MTTMRMIQPVVLMATPSSLETVPVVRSRSRGTDLANIALSRWRPLWERVFQALNASDPGSNG